MPYHRTGTGAKEIKGAGVCAAAGASACASAGAGEGVGVDATVGVGVDATVGCHLEICSSSIPEAGSCGFHLPIALLYCNSRYLRAWLTALLRLHPLIWNCTCARREVRDSS